jgi:YVTN family beta-propeller protein
MKSKLFLMLAVATAVALLAWGATGHPTITAAIPVGNKPAGVAIDPSTNRIYVANADNNNVSVIDGTTDTVVAVVAAMYWPFGVAANPGTNRVYVTDNATDAVRVIDGVPTRWWPPRLWGTVP